MRSRRVRAATVLASASALVFALAPPIQAAATPAGTDWHKLVHPTATKFVPKRAIHPAAIGTPTKPSEPAQPVSGGTQASTATSITDAQGTYAATPFADAGSGGVGVQTGDFEWSYPLRVPPAPAGPLPNVQLEYDSQSIDGRTVSTNAQPSWVGEGWDLSLGSIHRDYIPCSSVPGMPIAQQTADECWAGDNATLSLLGHTSVLIKDKSSGVWHLKDDDGSTVSHVATGGSDYWVVTTQDGTQYYFGQNAQTHAVARVPVYDYADAGSVCRPTTAKSTFDASCTLPWEWGLDHVVDSHGNGEVIYYNSDVNHYDRQVGTTDNIETYQSSLYPTRVDYGLRSGHEFDTNAATDRVIFDTAARCTSNCTTHNSSTWPDTPWADYCASTTSCPGLTGPTFWTTVRLSGVDTQYWNGSTYAPVDSWTLTHDAPPSGDGTPGSLRLDSVTHTAGSFSLPTSFAYTAYANRVNTAGDGLPPLDKWRLTTITSETNAKTQIVYNGADCTPGTWPAPQSNTTRCFPVRWTPPGYTAAIVDWFTKYVVASVTTTETDNDGLFSGVATSYNYGAAAAWHHDEDTVLPETLQTWSDWRGYQTVTTTTGDASDGPQEQKIDRFYRGMSDDPMPGGTDRGTVTVVDGAGVAHEDVDALAGRQLDVSNLGGAGGSELTGESDSYWVSATASESIHNPTSTDPTAMLTENADFVRLAQSKGRAAISTGVRTTEVDTAYSGATGLPTQVDDHGDLATSGDDRCTKTTYTPAGNGLVNLPSEVKAFGGQCSAITSTSTPLSDIQTYYDGHTSLTSAPVHGDPTKNLAAKSGTVSSGLTWETTTAGFDALGRQTAATDGAGNTTTTAYSAISATALPSIATTNALNQTSTQYLDPRWGVVTATVDANNHRTDLGFDALGRLIQLWLPDRPKSANATGNLQYSYVVQRGAESYVQIQRLLRDGTSYASTFDIYDSLMRLRQVQSAAPGGNRSVTDTLYDSHGREAQVRGPYPATSTPSGSLYPGDPTSIPELHKYTYDGLGRQTADILAPDGTEAWRTSTAYSGDVTTVTPPQGGTLTASVTDARGHVTAVRQYTGSTNSTAALTTTYRYDPLGRMTGLTDATGASWSYTYDLAGNEISATDPDHGTTTMTYDADNRVATSTDARQLTLTDKYDALSRQTEVDNGSAVLDKWTYDSAGALGLLSSSTSYANNKAYTETVKGYDADDRPLGMTVTLPAGEIPGTTSAYVYSTGLEYNAAGDLYSTDLPAVGDLPSDQVARSYTAIGQPYGLYTNKKYLVVGTDYTGINQIQDYGLDNENGALTRSGVTVTYDPSTERVSRMQSTTPTATAADLHYSYDPAGNVTELQDTSLTDGGGSGPNNTQCFAYDAIRRLTAAWTPTASACGSSSSVTAGALGGPAPYWSTYSYDGVGDRLSQVDHGVTPGSVDTSRSYAYGVSGHAHAVASYTDTTGGTAQKSTYQYDATGDVTVRPGHTYTYDALGRVATDTDANNQKTSFIYDASGNLLVTERPDGSVLASFTDSSDVTTDLTVAANNTAKAVRYYWWGGKLIATRASAGFSLQFTDLHNTPVASAAPGGTYAITRAYSDPFGNNVGSTPAVAGNRGFVGGLVEPSGIVRLGARDYDPDTGRFLSLDPLLEPGDPQSLGGYAYADDDPVSKTDPSGLRVACLDDGTHCDSSGVSAPAPRGPSTSSVSTPAGSGQTDANTPGRSAAEQRHAVSHRSRPSSTSHSCPLWNSCNASTAYKNAAFIGAAALFANACRQLQACFASIDLAVSWASTANSYGALGSFGNLVNFLTSVLGNAPDVDRGAMAARMRPAFEEWMRRMQYVNRHGSRAQIGSQEVDDLAELERFAPQAIAPESGNPRAADTDSAGGGGGEVDTPPISGRTGNIENAPGIAKIGEPGSPGGGGAGGAYFGDCCGNRD